MASDFLLKTGSIVLLLGGLIFVHELGHFLAAKALGVKVLKFSIGFGPKLFGLRWHGTEYLVSILPLGGYVKMAGDDPGEEVPPEDRGKGFLEQRPWKRFAIAFAGPGANLAFPVIIYFALALAQNGSSVPGPTLGTISPGSPAEKAGLRSGDRVTRVGLPDGRELPVRYFADLRQAVGPRPGDRLEFTVERGGERLVVPVVPAAEKDVTPLETTVRGVIGVTPAFPPAVVAPTAPGAAGPLRPFDLVVEAAGRPVRHMGELARILDASGCAPVDVQVLRERPVDVAGVAVSSYEPVRLSAVPTCAGGQRTLAAADPSVSTFVAEVAPGSPAAQAGLVRGDRITAVNGRPVQSFRELNQLAPEFLAGKAVRLDLAGGRTAELVPAEEEYRDELTREPKRRVTLGFFPDQRALVQGKALLAEDATLSIGAGEALSSAVGHLVEVVRLTALGIARIVSGEISFKTVGGPIMLFSIAAQAAQEGWESFLFKMALISVNLGLMNLLPIPVLDGGHIAATAVEAVTRRPLSLRAREVANLVGILLLVFLMIFVFKNDIVRLMG
ncbi:MAG TPA: site-2 protease family protein [Anaeromyxobacteraceae bacterium]|nr:site-2 protease family protein [Anaeromyxobacteraceae bacterium]